MSDVRETVFRVMTKARVFSRKKDGMITQLYIEESTVGTLPSDNLTGEQVAFVKKNGEALGLAVAMSLLHIAQAKTPAEKRKAARTMYGEEQTRAEADVAADQQGADAAKALAGAVIDASKGPVIPNKGARYTVENGVSVCDNCGAVAGQPHEKGCAS